MSKIIESAEQACIKFNAGMAELFPAFMAKAHIRNILGQCLVVEFANVADRKDAPNQIIMNATGHMQFMMHLCGNTSAILADGTPVELELNTWHFKCRSVLKFRKIKGKTPAEALDKLLAWFAKNADTIKGL